MAKKKKVNLKHKCEKCGTKLVGCPSLDDYCPNKECDRDLIKPEDIKNDIFNVDYGDDKKNIMEKLMQLWKMRPDQRFGQLLCNYLYEQSGQSPMVHMIPFYETDEDFIERLNAALERMKKDDGGK